MKKIIFAIAVVGITLAALAQTTQQRGEVQTSRFTREALTNETALGWRTKLGVGTGGESTTNYNLATSTNLPYAGLDAAARGNITNTAERAAQNSTNNFNGRNIADGTISTNEIDATFRSWVASMATGTNSGGGGIASNYIITSMATGVWYTNDTEYTALLLLSINFGQVGDAESGVWFQLDTSGGNTVEYQTQYFYDDHDAGVNKDMTARMVQYIPAGATFHFQDVSVGGSTVNIGGSNTDDNRLIYFGSGGGGGGPGIIEDGSISTNKINSTFYNWVLEQAGASMSAAEFSARLATNAIDAANISGDLSVDNLAVTTLTAGSIVGDATLTRDVEVPAIMVTNGSGIRFNVKAFGAKGDGNTLDELAVQAAIDAASTNGGTVWFPSGTYRIGTNNPLTSYTVESYPCFLTLRSNNVVLEGESREKAILLVGTNAPASWNFIGSQRVTNCAIKNLTLDAASFQNVVDMTQIYYPDNFLFENVIFKNMKDGDACDVQYGNVVKVSGCEFYNIGGNCVSSQERIIIVENCRGLGTGFSVSENRSVDGATSPTSVIQNYASKMVVSDSTFENCSIGLDLGLGAVVMNNVDFVFTNTTAITNMWVAGGTLELNNCHLLSSSAFAAGHLIAVNTNRSLTIRGGSFDGKRQIFANQPPYAGINIRGATFGKVILNNSHAITLNSADGAIIESCDFYGNGYRGINLDSGLLASDNVKVSGGYYSGMSIYCESSGSTNLFVTDVSINNGSSPVGLWAGSGHHVKNSSLLYAATSINVPARVENNTISSLSFSLGAGAEFVGNTIMSGVSGTASQINANSWRDNRGPDYKPLRNYTITTNYTADSIDAVLIFNGSNLTNTIPSAVTLNRGNEFIIKNLHATALEITNSTGAQTFDGALRLSLAQYGAVRLRSDGANWNIISVNP